MRRIPGGHPEDASQVERIGDVGGDRDVTDVGRIERAPEEADAPPARRSLGQGAFPAVSSSAAAGESG